MEKARLHPLLTAAALSVTVFSAVGIGALTGLLPSSLGSSEPAAQAETVLAAPPQPAQTLPSIPEKGMPPAAAKATPKSKPKAAKKQAVAAPAVAPELPQIQAQAPKPIPAGVLGVVESVREIKQPAEKSNGVGPIAGGIAGAIFGNQFGKGGGRSVMTVLGAAGGALAGKEIERNVRATKHWEIAVRLDDGSQRALTSEARPFWNAGDRVRMVDGRLEPV
jgi:outer membrane lipoprotein SlyB